MSAKLERIGEDLNKAREKWQRWGAKVKELEERYNEQENQEICGIIHAYQLSPEQLVEFLEVAGAAPPESPQAKAMLNGLLGRDVFGMDKGGVGEEDGTNNVTVEHENDDEDMEDDENEESIQE